ncbi:MAG: signal peptidase I [Tenericutes bacterium HGW-Tenericutes-6]|nr:MAG: signal peptidase I [Tenericutes bacterium HGW-Tenericutes-6]
MTLKKAYKTLILTVLLMMLSVILYAYHVTRLSLRWGIIGLTVAGVFSIFSIILSIHQVKHQKDVKLGFWSAHRFEILDWFTFLSISLMVIFMVFSFAILPSDVQQNSMYPTLKPGERIVINHFLYEPERDDVIIIEITKDSYPLVSADKYVERDSAGRIIATHDRIYFVKRLVALPGDLVDFIIDPENPNQSIVRINGEIIYTPYDEAYYVIDDQIAIISQSLDSGILKDGLYLAFGDNANGFTYDPITGVRIDLPGSFDSRGFGSVLEEDIIGKVIFRLWPMGAVK